MQQKHDKDVKNNSIQVQPMYTVGHEKTLHFTFAHIFADYWLIFKILSLAHSADNMQ